MNSAFWRGRRVLVTGHTGFKGAWLSQWLLDAGAAVTGFALPAPTTPSLFAEAHLDQEMDSLLGDLRDIDAVRACVRNTRPEIVLHLAAQALVRASYADPLGTFATNVMGTAHLLDALRTADSVRAIVVVTSDKCYRNDEAGRPFIESDPLGGRDPYSASKGATELVTAAYRRSFFSHDDAAGIATARAGNVIGGGDWAADRLVPDLLRAFEGATTATVRRPDAVRPWQHVIEPLAGYMRLAEALHADPNAFGDAFNFGPSTIDMYPVAWMAERVAQRWGHQASWQVVDGPQPPEAGYLTLDSARAARQLGWTSRLDAAEAIDWTVEWHRAWRDGQSPRTLCRDQWARYDARRAT